MLNFLSELVYGGIDGLITTFSIVAGSIGGNLSNNVIIILGLSNVLSDGFSMGVSRYYSAQTELAQGLLLNKNALTSSIMTFIFFVIIGCIPILPFLIKTIKYKNNKKNDDENKEIDNTDTKKISIILALLSFAMIGALKGYYLKKSILYSSSEIFITGSIASLISYYIGKILNENILN